MNPGFWRTERGRLIADFLAYKAIERGFSPISLISYRYILRQFCAWGRSRSGSLLTTKERHFRRYLAVLHSRGLSERTIAHHLVVMREFFRWAQMDGLMYYDPMVRIDIPEQWFVLPRVFALSEIKRILECRSGYSKRTRLWRAEELRDKAICELAYSSALRASEITNLRLADLKHDRVLVMGKGSKERTVPLGQPAAWALVTYLEVRGHFRHAAQSPFVFVGRSGRHISRQRLWQIVNQRAKLAKLEHFHPHSFRHSCATHMVDNDADLRTVQEILGHADISTTEIYTHTSLAHVRRVYLKAHPRGEKLILERREAYRQEYLRDFRREYRVQHLAQAVCIECTAPVCPDSKSRCARHHLAAREGVYRHNRNRRVQGICRNCPLPVEAPSRYYCAVHREKYNARTRAYMQQKRAAQKTAAAA
jgi:integrase/recombinase XerD